MKKKKKIYRIIYGMRECEDIHWDRHTHTQNEKKNKEKERERHINTASPHTSPPHIN